MAIAATAMIQALAQGAEMQATAQRQLLAGQILQQEMDNLRLQPWATIAAMPAGPTTLTIPSSFTEDREAGIVGVQSILTLAGLPHSTVTLTRTVADVPGTSSKVKEITLTIRWTMDPSGSAGVRTYSRVSLAYFTEYGLNLTARRT